MNNWRLHNKRVQCLDGTRNEVVRLYCEGHSYSYIATSVGISESSIRKIVGEEFKANNADRQELIERTTMQLDNMIRRALENYYESSCTDVKNAEIALKAIDQRRKLRGLDEPTKVKVEHSIETMSLEEINHELEKYGYRELPAASGVVDAEFTVQQKEKVDNGPAQQVT